eukprot:840589-Pyramimonas_sp.AAC.2
MLPAGGLLKRGPVVPSPLALEAAAARWQRQRQRRPRVTTTARQRAQLHPTATVNPPRLVTNRNNDNERRRPDQAGERYGTLGA